MHIMLWRNGQFTNGGQVLFDHARVPATKDHQPEMIGSTFGYLQQLIQHYILSMRAQFVDTIDDEQDLIFRLQSFV